MAVTKELQTTFDLQSFRKVLELERSKGYADGSVMGGLDGYLKRWAPELAALLGDPSLAPRLAQPQYRDANLARRERLVGRLFELIEVASAGADDREHEEPPEHPPESPAESKPTARTKSNSKASTKSGAGLDSPVTLLKGINSRTAARMKRLEVETVRDLLYFFPRRHEDYAAISKISELRPGETHTIQGTVWEARESVRGMRNLKCTEAVVSDETGNVRVTFFGNPYMAKKLRTNSRVTLSGRVEVYKGQLEFQSPEYEFIDQQDEMLNAGRLVPVYSLTEGLAQRTLRRLTWQALERWLKSVEDGLDSEFRASNGLMELARAISETHYPSDREMLEEARRRLAFDELLVLQLAVLLRRGAMSAFIPGTPIPQDAPAVSNFIAGLPFPLTDAQKRCMAEIGEAMERSGAPMDRLLQGDVGSGKTVVALGALLSAVSAGFQGAIMAPTEVLAEQHFNTVAALLGGLKTSDAQETVFSVRLEPLSEPVSVGLLVGSATAAMKREVRRRLSEGTLDIVIGTHALIQDQVKIPQLALAVVDEQHRFGVLQRAALRDSSEHNPHLLVMSATPIPRTLAMTLYGELNISTIDEMPPGREPVRTGWVPTYKRDDAYRFVRQEAVGGRQAFVVCPLIEESESVEARAASVEYERLSQQVFPDLRLGLLHGRMRPAAKEEVMRSFRDGGLDILVSTPVVEVGIDVPNASVMLVEGADRFGLAQLHQFRGRVGRGQHQSYCLLLADDPGDEAKQRLEAVASIQDGFKLAEVDLELRGPGDFFGTRQSGLPSLHMARLSDTDLLSKAREYASTVLGQDPTLEAPQNRPLAAQVGRFLQEAVSDAG